MGYIGNYVKAEGLGELYVSGNQWSDVVYLRQDNGALSMEIGLPPKVARKIAKQLVKAAEVVESKGEK